MSRTARNCRRWLAATTAAAVAFAGGIALTPSASGAPGLEAKKPTPRAYQYGNWVQPGSGFTTGSDDTLSQVYQLTWRGAFPDLDDTPGPVYSAGTFIKSGSTNIYRVGRWDDTTSSWVTLPGDDTGIAPASPRSVVAGATNPGVYGMVLGGDDSLYVGGDFWGSDDSLNNVGQWNGSNWVRMGNGIYISSPDRTAGEVVQDMVIGNDFIGGDDLNYADDTVYALGGFEGTCATLACTGQGRNASAIAQYSQADDTWYGMATGTSTDNFQLYAGAYIDDTLYVGGSLGSSQTLGGQTGLAGVAQWRESDDTWLPLGGGMADGIVYAMAVNPITKDLYVGGTFTKPTGNPTLMPALAKWDYTDDTWYAVGTGLTAGAVDDISFSADGKTMYLGMNPGQISGVTANYVGILASTNLDDTTATTVNGTWSYIKSAGVIGVTGPAAVGGLNQQFVRAALAQPSDTVMFGGNFHTAGAVSAGRVATFTPGPEPSPFDPVYPPGVPTGVTAVGGWNKVTVDWTAPTYTGSYPITNYLVTSSPGNRNCITTLADAKLTQCTFTSLTPGTQYTFRVQGLNGGGWGDRSAASNVASPQNLKITSYSRKKLTFAFINRGSEVRAGGVAPGFAPATKIVPWVKIGDKGWEANPNSGLGVDSLGKFNWSRKFSKNQNGQAISVKFVIGENFSNTVVINGIR